MKRMTLLVFAMILTVAALKPGTSEAAGCSPDQCFYNADCSQFYCPPGQTPMTRCDKFVCEWYCACRPIFG